MRSASWAGVSSWTALVYVALFVWLAARVQAQPSLALDGLGEADLASRVALLRDPERGLTFAQVRERDAAFVDNAGRPLSFGYDRSAIWLRFSAENRGQQTTRWLLEVAEPLLDHVELYAVHGSGRVEHLRSGDALPFAARAVKHANVVFELHSPPGDAAVYYLRVQSDDVLRAPLHAWQPGKYSDHHELDGFLQSLCAGALLLVALYHFGVFSLVRQVENIWYALVAVSLAGVLLSLDGRLGQFLLPHHAELANRMPPLTMAIAMFTVAFFTYAATHSLGTQPALSRVLRHVALSSASLVPFAAFAPPGVAMRVLSAILLLITLSGPLLLRAVRRYEIPELGLYSLGWYALIISIPIAVLRYAGVWPDGSLARWVLPVGFVLYGIMNSIALAALASRLRRELAAMNDRLVSNVRELEQALVHAKEANEKAQRATKAKDEFVANMSHELRTPLNTIINIPQGLAGEFVRVRSARCSHCAANFLLDSEDHIDGDTLCESCQRRGTLVEATKVKFQGDEGRALSFLQKIERSGQHLLQMVNGVLDYSKLEAGRFELALGPVDMDALLREVHDQMFDIAQRKGVQLEFESQCTQVPTLVGDALRLKQVLINLLANAIKFSEEGTTVTVRWRSLPDAEAIEIIDCGIGIAPENHERIFTSFEQVHKGDTRRYGGTGLGLSISRSLVRMHGGELSVTSEIGKGATFLVHLPRSTYVPQPHPVDRVAGHVAGP